MTNTSPGEIIVKNPNCEVTPLDSGIFPEVLKLDHKFFGTDRSYLLRSLSQNHPGKSFVLRRNNRLDGYIFGRDGIKYNYIGPVNAFSDKSARILIEKALESMHNKPVALDILADKEDLIKWLESIGFVKQRHFIRKIGRASCRVRV